MTAFNNSTAEGADITVGIEVADPKGSLAIGEGFASSEIAPPGQYLRDDPKGGGGTVAWIAFITRASKGGYELKQPLSLFEVYSFTEAGKEQVSLFVAVDGMKAEK